MKNISSKRTFGDECFLSVETRNDHRQDLKKHVAKFPVEELCSSDEVAVIYRCIPSRAMNEGRGTSSFIRVKNRLTVVLTIFSNGEKAPLSVLEKSMRPRSFPRPLNLPRDLCQF